MRESISNQVGAQPNPLESASFGLRLGFQIAPLAREVEENLGLKEFLIIGGAAVDTIIGRSTNPSEIDVAVEGTSPVAIEQIRKRCYEKGFAIVVEPFEYLVNYDEKAYLMLIQAPGRLYDVSFLAKRSIGQFNLESLYYKHPEGKVVDEHGAIEGLAQKRIVPVRGLDKENPHLLLGRFLKLSRKYDISPGDRQSHTDILSELSERIIRFPADFGSVSECFSAEMCLEFLWAAKNPVCYFQQLQNLGVIRAVFPELSIRDSEQDSSQREMAKALVSSGSVRELRLRLGDIGSLAAPLEKRISAILKWSWADHLGSQKKRGIH